jgi:hypothetical protein
MAGILWTEKIFDGNITLWREVSQDEGERRKGTMAGSAT